MKLSSSRIVAAAILVTLSRLSPAGPPPQPGNAVAPPPDLQSINLIRSEMSWDFGDLGPDWRDELSSTEPEQRFFVRFKQSDPTFSGAELVLEKFAGPGTGIIPLPDRTPDENGYREYGPFKIGELPVQPGMRLKVRSLGGNGFSVANTLKIYDAPDSTPPFLYTPLFFLDIANNFGVPGVGGAYWCGRTDETGEQVDGIRLHGGGSGDIERGDHWHIGSCSKAVTTTFLGLLIQRGTPLPGTGAPLTWDSSLFDVYGTSSFGDSLHPRFQTTTLRMLACHRSGLRMNSTENAPTRDMSPGSLNLTNPRLLRRNVTQSLLSRQHFEIGQPTVPTSAGTDFYYGSGNYLILAAVIEELLNQPFETVITTQFLVPLLGSTSAFYGMPVALGVADQPHGHRRQTSYPFAIYPDNTPQEPAWNSAGGLSWTFRDWLAFCRLHIRGSEGGISLTSQTLEELHKPYPSDDGISYAPGWGVSENDGNKQIHHGGSYFRFCANVFIDLTANWAAVSASNIDFETAAGDDAAQAVMDHFIGQLRYKNAGLETAFLAGSPNRNLRSSGMFDRGLPFDTPESRGLEQVFRKPGFIDDFPASAWVPFDNFTYWQEEVRRFPEPPEINSVRRGRLILSARGEPGFRYQVVARTRLDRGEWEPIDEFVASERPESVTYEIPRARRSGFFALRRVVK